MAGWKETAKRILEALFGLIFAGFAFLMFIVGQGYLITERTPLLELPTLTTELAQKLPENADVLIQGKISERNPELYKNFVFGCHQRYVSGENAYWADIRCYEQPVTIDLDSGGQAVIKLHSLRTRGQDLEIRDPKDRDKRWIGMKKGQSFTATGKLTSQDPLQLSTTRHFGGTRQEYLDSLKISVVWFIIVGAFVVVGLAFSASRIVKLRKTRGKKPSSIEGKT